MATPTQEHELIAFEPAPLPPGPWLVFAPHGDDETFGMGGSLIKAGEPGDEPGDTHSGKPGDTHSGEPGDTHSREPGGKPAKPGDTHSGEPGEAKPGDTHSRKRVGTHIIVLTDGALGGNEDGLVSLRREEVERAGAILGVTSLAFWDEPDRQLTITPALVDRVSEAIIATRAASVFFPGPLELHPDHRVAGRLVWSALGQVAQQRGTPLPAAISYEISVQNPCNTLIDISGQVARKEKAMAVYASQNNQNNYPELVLALNKGRTFTLPADVKFAEGFYRYSEAERALTFQEATRTIIDLYFG